MKRSLPKRGVGQQGQAAVEAVMIVALTFGLIFLVMDMAMVMYCKSALQDAVRDGVRFGVTGHLLAGDTYLNDSIVHAVQNNSLGLLSGAAGACKVQVNYYDPAGVPAAAPAGGNLLEIVVQGYQYQPLSAVLKSGNPLSVTVRAADVMETCSSGGCPPGSNPSPPACP